jgi:hypothetical protein
VEVKGADRVIKIIKRSFSVSLKSSVRIEVYAVKSIPIRANHLNHYVLRVLRVELL